MFKKTPDLVKYPNLEPGDEIRDPYLDGDEVFVRFLAWLVFGFCIMAIPAMILDIGGRDDNEHPFSLPAGITALNGYNYMTPLESRIKPEEICWGNGVGASKPVLTNKDILVQGKLVRYIECSEEQTFSTSFPKEASMNFGDALLIVWSKWYFWPILVLWTLAWLPWTYIYKARHNRNWRKAILSRKIEANKDIEEQRLREIAAAYANDQISRDEYDNGIERAYMAGVPKTA